VTEPSDALDEVVHQRTRLGILTITHEARRVEFGFLQETLGLTAGNLSKHLQVLEDADFVRIEKGYDGRRAKTWVAMTRRGADALQMEVLALKGIVTRVEKANRATKATRPRSLRVATELGG
jgi:DNA-binding MarR family transcriptional regulator